MWVRFYCDDHTRRRGGLRGSRYSASQTDAEQSDRVARFPARPAGRSSCGNVRRTVGAEFGVVSEGAERAYSCTMCRRARCSAAGAPAPVRRRSAVDGYAPTTALRGPPVLVEITT